ncbi:MAG: aminodeoxychorismate synthase component I [Lysobacteraceae bacterium]|nr:MAG: aminodeoxychorismate synthase component I [Xanthomonadaceae bacterium]
MIVTRALPADFDPLDLHRRAPQRYPMLLQSTSSASQVGRAPGRWDLLLATSGEAIVLANDGRVRDAHGTEIGTDFLATLDRAWAVERIAREEPRWPFRGGWALFLGYELAAQIEPVLHLPCAEGGLPRALALRCPVAVLRDHATGECVAIAEPGHEGMLEHVLADCDHARMPSPSWRPPQDLEEDADAAFLEGVRRILDYLAAGDVFQVNLSRGWRARFEPALDPAALYARLRAASPAPFAGMFTGRSASGGWAVASSSPERLVSVRGEIVETRPIAGTRPRFAGDDDAARIRELVGHPKERAEHVMLIDLERNDLGRICTAGSIEVDELMSVESYAHVHHIVSNVRGRLHADTTPGDVIRAVFPGGTITGCPKVRCMQIIAELEGAGRGAYTGAMGWLNRDGDLDLNILIRSAEIETPVTMAEEPGGSVLRFRTGAGIVADSDPQRELDETRAKARGMLKALGAEG